MNRIIRPWSFIKVGSCLFQLYDDGIDSTKLLVSNLEYDMESKNISYGKLRESDGVKYLRFGLGIPISNLASTPYSKYITDSTRLLRKMFIIKEGEISQIIDLTEKTKEIVSGTVRVDPGVFADFVSLYTLLSKSGIDVSALGVEGSLLAGTTSAESDLDLVLYGENNYKIFLEFFNKNKKWSPDVELFQNSEFGRKSIYNARKHYSPLSQDEMIFHEARKPTGFIKYLGHSRKFSIVGILDHDDTMRKKAIEVFNLDKTFRIVGVCTVKGLISSDQFAPFRPSFYSTSQCTIVNLNETITQEIVKNIKYIVDYLGNFYLHCKVGEQFECRASIEEMIVGGKRSNEYRLNINHWDDHIQNKFYLKTINNQT